jgi:hypothetical protein
MAIIRWCAPDLLLGVAKTRTRWRDNPSPEEPVPPPPAPGFEPVPVELGPAAGDAMQNVVMTPAESTSPAESSSFAATQARNKKPLADISRAKHHAGDWEDALLFACGAN